MVNSFYPEEELYKIGFKSIGKNVLISKKASFYSVENIVIGSNVRIDDFCILSGSITIGNYIHISAYSALYGSKGIFIDDFSGLSPRTTVYSAIDDFSGEFLIGPLIEKKFRKLKEGPVYIKKYVQVGANTIIFPNLSIEEGVAIGAFSLVNVSLEAWKIYVGIPAKFFKERKRELLLKKDELLSKYAK